ncbi:hypothetical protein HN51_065738 [Arachis hypogaea]|uniref:Protein TRIGALACTOSYLDIACYLGLYCEROL 4 n=1 Tax=Arachis hypogaea TaxID=3818 RepID=A0A444ZGW6_ARAHY|nr:protein TRIGALACTOSYLDIACYLGLYCEROL 4, chloroplastic [Arachis ipaensis]XP_025646721.1 protein TRIGALACTOSYLDIACYLGLYCEROL 4, chloroplastic [Arachis hypogaea]QHO06982.1 Protein TRIGALACTOSYLDIACYLGLYCEROL 4 [Arachis hypogaea]QHO06983.1 Protein TRIGALACTOSYLDIACYLGLYCEROL 4 [Arachis hypogaea]RYR13435.1 hypothetical protein Ahy_B04g070438 isoform B [Arachis hypogaea]
MRKLRWVMDGGGFWDLDVSTPKTLEGSACPVSGNPLPLGLSRGPRLSRPKQVDFMQRFMFAPFVPSFSKPNGLSLQRVLSLPLNDDWVVYLLGQFHLQKFISFVKRSEEKPSRVSSWFKTIGRQLQQKSLYALGLFSEFQLTSDDILHLALDYDDNPRGKAILRHKFPSHELTAEAVLPGLFVDKSGNYWDVPFSMAIDFASLSTSDSSMSYHLSAHYNSGSPEPFDRIQNQIGGPPRNILPGLALKSSISFRNKVDIWKSEAPKLKLVQPYDLFISNPNVSASWNIGAAATTGFGESAERALANEDPIGFFIDNPDGLNASFLADTFASASLTAQLGNFQKRYLDLTRFQAQLNIPSGTKFFYGARNLAREYFQSRKPSLDDFQAVCPDATLSFQQQIFGPLSFRVDSGVTIDLKDPNIVKAKDSVIAIEYALQVLLSAKAVAWYCPQRQEFMAELRFYEK